MNFFCNLLKYLDFTLSREMHFCLLEKFYSMKKKKKEKRKLTFTCAILVRKCSRVTFFTQGSWDWSWGSGYKSQNASLCDEIALFMRCNYCLVIIKVWFSYAVLVTRMLLYGFTKEVQFFFKWYSWWLHIRLIEPCNLSSPALHFFAHFLSRYSMFFVWLGSYCALVTRT